MRLAKNEEWRKFGESLEKNANMNHKAFWAKLRKQRRGKDSGCKSVLSKYAVKLTGEDEIIGRWMEHFKELSEKDEGRLMSMKKWMSGRRMTRK